MNIPCAKVVIQTAKLMAFHRSYHGTSSLSPWDCGQVGKVGATSSTLSQGEAREEKGKNERVRKVRLVRKR